MLQTDRKNLDADATLAELETRFASTNPNSQAAHAAACRAMPGGNTGSVLFSRRFHLRSPEGKAVIGICKRCGSQACVGAQIVMP